LPEDERRNGRISRSVVARRRAITGQPNRSDLHRGVLDVTKSQSAGSRNKAGGAASIHIGIATGSVNKMNGTRNNAAQMQKIAPTTITGIKNTNNNNNNISINKSFSLRRLT